MRDTFKFMGDWRLIYLRRFAILIYDIRQVWNADYILWETRLNLWEKGASYT
jgi:hypothetical protein